jgi:hypothetical protein
LRQFLVTDFDLDYLDPQTILCFKFQQSSKLQTLQNFQLQKEPKAKPKSAKSAKERENPKENPKEKKDEMYQEKEKQTEKQSWTHNRSFWALGCCEALQRVEFQREVDFYKENVLK